MGRKVFPTNAYFACIPGRRDPDGLSRQTAVAKANPCSSQETYRLLELACMSEAMDAYDNSSLL